MATHRGSTPERGRKKTAIARLVIQVQQIVEQSGNPQGFDASTWVAEWLEQPLPALGGGAPAEYMHSAAGRKVVTSLLSQTQSGAFA